MMPLMVPFLFLSLVADEDNDDNDDDDDDGDDDDHGILTRQDSVADKARHVDAISLMDGAQTRLKCCVK